MQNRSAPLEFGLEACSSRSWKKMAEPLESSTETAPTRSDSSESLLSKAIASWCSECGCTFPCDRGTTFKQPLATEASSIATQADSLWLPFQYG